mgnify:CR=1 FL=1
MFTTLHELAQRATLMITIAPEGADQLRVNVTPVPADSKAKASLPMPLSLVATPAEFDADFPAALATWHAPKRSLVEQAQAATGGAPAAAPALPAPKEGGKNDKSSKKGRGKADGEQKPGALPVAGDATSEAAGEEERPGRPAGAGDAEPGDNPGPAPADHEPTAADLTLDLF